MPGLEIVTEQPPNAGVHLQNQTGRLLEQGEMYIRCNLPIPRDPPEGFILSIPGQTERFITVEDFAELTLASSETVLECAGNGRTMMDPVPEGTPWTLGGASPILVHGVLLRDVLGRLPAEVVEVVFTGADAGDVEPEGEVHYQFSISAEQAMSDAAILVTHIGGESLILEHGAPIRLVVLGDYAMKSVKWLTKVEALTAPFSGHFVDKYRYYGDPYEDEGSPVGLIAPRSIIAEPIDGSTMPRGRLRVSGSAWSGSGPIDRVEVSTDGGSTWQMARVTLAPTRYAAAKWESHVDVAPGKTAITVRATDSEGHTQPTMPRWNRNGYANNVVHTITIQVMDS